MAKESVIARESSVSPLNAVRNGNTRSSSRGSSNLNSLLGERERIYNTSGIRLSDNARELKYGSREWERATNEGAWRSHRTEDNRSFFIKYDGSMFYERKRR